MDVRTFRGVNIDSDHYLVAAKIRMRLCRAKTYAPSRNESWTSLGCDHNGQQQPTPLTSRNCSTNLPLFLLTPADSGRTYPTPCELPLKQPLGSSAHPHGTNGFKTGASNCRDENGNLVTDTQCTLRLWRAHFSQLLAGDDGTNPAIGGSSPIPPIDDNVDIPLPSHDEVRVAIMRLKNNKAAGADGLPAELFKAGGEELIRCMHQLFCKIWVEDSMPNDWNLSVLCPVLKKGDPTICTNYRGISLIAISYKVLSSVICERLKPYTSTLIGPYQCGFRPGKSTIDQIFTLRQILEKTHENGIDTHHLFVDYKAAFDSPTRERLYATMSEFGIPAKLIRLCRMTLSSTISSVKVGTNLSEPFNTVRGFRQGDPFVMEGVLRKADIHRAGTIFIKVSSSLLTLMILTSLAAASVMETRRLDSHVVADSYTFEVVKEFTYLGTAINTKNDVSLEIKRRITLANRCYFGLKAWVVSITDAAVLGVFERKILRKIFGPVRIGDDFRIRMNHELYELYDDVDVVRRITIQRLRWLGHVVRMDEESPAQKVFEARVDYGRRRRGRPNLRWKDQVEQELNLL
ncbi:uncharacterized protein LOC132798106, partial [Drosophila nasuta]|uniref:uncharacterized protein LOC132798106 n=1 Tax=Drosophila nasuta TaxID=42062 RepID=UPI00295E6752